MHEDAVEELLFSTKTSQFLLPVWRVLDEYLIERGLERYAKTISVSYTNTTSRLVAAVHPDPVKGLIEVALALPKSMEHEQLYDAVLLRWRTLPVAFALASTEEFNAEIKDLVDQAIAGEVIEAFDTSDYVSERDRRMRKGRERWAAD